MHDPFSTGGNVLCFLLIELEQETINMVRRAAHAADSASMLITGDDKMRLLLFSDLHRDTDAARNLVEMSRDTDAVIGAGDFATMRKGIHEIINVLAVIERPTILVPGNSESYEELAAACEGWPAAMVLHGSGTEVDGIKFWGVGGAIPITPFGSWSYDFSEDDGRRLLADCPSGAILVSHSPPKGAVDKSSRGQSLGSVAVLEAVEKNQPILVVCGHIHDSSGRCELIRDTPVVNAGPRGIVREVSG
jgi:Icc-related predicted phosphoesterase